MTNQTYINEKLYNQRKMQIRHESSRKEVAQMSTEELREHFLIETLFAAGQLTWVYSHYDRVLTGGAMPVATPLTLETYEALRADGDGG